MILGNGKKLIPLSKPLDPLAPDPNQIHHSNGKLLGYNNMSLEYIAHLKTLGWKPPEEKDKLYLAQRARLFEPKEDQERRRARERQAKSRLSKRIKDHLVGPCGICGETKSGVRIVEVTRNNRFGTVCPTCLT